MLSDSVRVFITRSLVVLVDGLFWRAFRPHAGVDPDQA
jgi:hypothetical protein